MILEIYFYSLNSVFLGSYSNILRIFFWILELHFCKVAVIHLLLVIVDVIHTIEEGTSLEVEIGLPRNDVESGHDLVGAL